MDELFGEDEDIIENKDILSPRPSSCGVLSFHAGTEDSLFLYLERNVIRGDPQTLLTAIDTFCYKRHWMMHIGDQKLRILQSEVLDFQSKNEEGMVCLEIGSYCGYSAVGIAAILRPGDTLYCVDCESKCIEWTQRMVEFAGVQDKVTLIEGVIDEITIEVLRNKIRPKCIDIVFIDHDKQRYCHDLQFVDEHDLLKQGTVVIADNILSFGHPINDYLDYVRDPAGPFQSSKSYQSTVEYSCNVEGVSDAELPPQFIDAVEVSVHR